MKGQPIFNEEGNCFANWQVKMVNGDGDNGDGDNGDGDKTAVMGNNVYNWEEENKNLLHMSGSLLNKRTHIKGPLLKSQEIVFPSQTNPNWEV